MQHTAFYDCKDCGTRVRDVVEDCSDEDKDNTCDKCARCFHASTELVPNDNGTHNVVCCECGEPLSTDYCQYTNIGSATYMDENYHSVENWCDCGNTTSGIEPHTYGDDGFCECGKVEPTGWVEKDGAWYYVYGNYTNATGKARLPYPTVAINGITYAPNAEDLAYADFIDAMEAWFFFDEEGKFIQETTLLDDNGVLRYIENGMIAWHPGFVTYGDQLYYFVGDKEIGGNKAADGIVYVTRGTGENTYKAGYIWFKEGLVDTTKNDYIAEIKGNLFYFENGVCLTKRGLKKLDDGKYIYIRSGGKLAIGVYYADGKKYEFDENGYSTGLKDGIVDGKYYVDGHVQYGAGVKKMTDEQGNIFYIYVKSNGELATGIYWPTTTNDLLDRGAYNWGEDGKYYPDAPKTEEIREESGNYYYYINGIKQIGSGVVEMTDEQGEIFYIYVKSNGKLATGKYWPTTRNDLLPRGEYDWGKDGKYYPAD
jgi:glucan-binding YG repeat protein